MPDTTKAEGGAGNLCQPMARCCRLGGLDAFRRKKPRSRIEKWVIIVCIFLLGSSASRAQFSDSAYRGLGQPDLRQNGVNTAEGAELNGPIGLALDTGAGNSHLYVADTGNHRVLAWKDAESFQNGEPADLVLGQRSPFHVIPFGIGVKGFLLPVGAAVDPTTGDLYVADFGNHRVLRFPAPFENSSSVEPDAVYGQPDFDSRDANTGGVSRSSLNRPRAVELDRLGNLWVADSGNHRVLRFPADILDLPDPTADLVIGQADFESSGINEEEGPRGINALGLDSPAGLAFDGEGTDRARSPHALRQMGRFHAAGVAGLRRRGSRLARRSR